MESLANAGAFDCFTEIHRAQYFFTPPNETASGLERIIRFGQVYQTQYASASNTLFGDLPMMDNIAPPKIPECPPWPLTIQLEHEKEVTGMFISGHPLDHYKFEIKHYGVTTIANFNEFKEAISTNPNPNRGLRLIGLVSEVQHRISKQGNKYGNFIIEDYSGKTTLLLFSEDYMKFNQMLQQGNTVFINGFFKQRYNRDEFDFKVLNVSLVETMKRHLTRQVNIEVHPKNITDEMIRFVEKNIKEFPGGTTLKFTVTEPKNKWKISLVSLNKGFEMNNEMIDFLQQKQELDVQVVTI